jgi:hypothetical protein
MALSNSVRDIIPVAEAGGEVIEIEPPAWPYRADIMSNGAISKRLEQQVSTQSKSSFADYMKAYDILTGEKKVQTDEKALRRQEAAVIKKGEDLLGGPAPRPIDISKIIASHSDRRW